MRKTLLIVLMMAGMAAYAAEPGQTCRTAIPLTKDFTQAITKTGTEVWYSAWTFDLPLSVSFVPDEGMSMPAPEVEMDFSCTSGYYEDSILCSLFCKTSGSSGLDMKMPYKQTLEKKDGKYTLSLGKRYRDLLLQMGISYNLKVVVKVKYNCTGKLTMNPDAFTDCMDGPQFMRFGDTVKVAAKDKETHVIIPYLQWQEDTVVYTWKGTTPCTMAVANDCDFDPTDNNNDDIIQYVPDIMPGTSVKALATDIYKWVHNPEFPNQAGMYFAKFYSEEPGEMKITKAPQAKPRANATLMRYGSTYALDANSSAVFAIPDSWTKDTKFTTPTAHVFTMLMDTTPKFNSDIKKEYSFNRIEEGHWKGLTASDLNYFWSKTNEKYVYVKFVCTESTTVTPDYWTPSNCDNATLLPHSTSQTITVTKGAGSPTYRIYYEDWLGADINFSFEPTNAACEIYLYDSCEYFSQARANWKSLENGRLKMNPTAAVSESNLSSWAERIKKAGKEGYLYMHFFHNVNLGGQVTITSEAPAEVDPEYPSATIAAECVGQTVVVKVTKAQTITVKDASSVTKDTWGAEPGVDHTLSLPSGTYTVIGETEQIEITLP